MLRKRIPGLVMVLCAASAPAVAFAQPRPGQAPPARPAQPAQAEPPPPAVDPEALKALESQIRALEERTKQAEAKAGATADQLAALKAELELRKAEEKAAAEKAAAEKAEAERKAKEEPEPEITFGGYVEAFYQWNINDPENRITNFRGFDNRHNSVTISNVALDGQLAFRGVQARVTLQAGHTPDTYYLAEPLSPGAGGASTSSLDTWRFVQQAYAGYELDALKGILVQGGIFLSPIGPESIAVKDNWQWSRSNLFFGLPFYHTGLRATVKATDEWTVTAAVVNGWNSVVDNNPEKSGYLQLNYTSDALAWSLLYFGGIERPDDVPEGDPWRNTFDTHLTWTATDWLKVQPHFDAGFEPNDFGTSYWVAGALAAQFKVIDWLYLGVRGDVFYEKTAGDATGEAGRIFWPVDWVASQTATLEARAADHISARLEYRHDHAAGDMYFAGDVAVDADGAFVPDARYQDTVTLGATAWF